MTFRQLSSQIVVLNMLKVRAFQDVRVRQAMNYAVNKKAILASVLAGLVLVELALRAALLRRILVRRLLVQGFIVYDHSQLAEAFLAEVGPLVQQGAILWREDVVEGLENAPAAFLGLLTGRSFGKLVVKVASPS